MVTAGAGIELATTTPQAHISDGGDATANATAIAAILDALENVGILATS